MLIAAFVFMLIAGVVHIGIFFLESVLWRSRSTWRMFGTRSAEAAETIRPWALNQGFYNLFLALGAIGGVAGWVASWINPQTGTFGWTAYVPLRQSWLDSVAETPIALVGTSIAAFAALCMVGASIVLLASTGRRALRPALIQGGPPLIGLVLLSISIATFSVATP